MSAPYAASNMVLPTANNYGEPTALFDAANTGGWYQKQYGCLRGVDPTEIARRHTFPDACIPRGVPDTPGGWSKIVLEYRNSNPLMGVDSAPMVVAESEHPTFAFHAGGPVTVHQIDVESQLRRLDQPLTKCQAVIAEDAPLYRNTVAPPPPMNVDPGAQNAANPIAAIVRPGSDACRAQADSVAMSLSGRMFHNLTRQDTARMDKPFAPPGIGSGSPSGRMGVSVAAAGLQRR